MKQVTVHATFPEVIENGYQVEVTAQAEASTFKAAVSRAVGLALKSASLKRKRIKSAKFEVTVKD